MHRVTTRAARGPRRADEAAQTMAEYAMVLSIITIGIMLAVISIGDSAGALIDTVTAFLT